MKRIASYFLAATLVSGALTRGAEVMEPTTPKELRFIFADRHYMTDQARLDWASRLSETPDITNKLYDLLWKYADTSYSNEIGWILFALGQRSDLSEAQLKKITDRIQSLAVGSIEKLPMEEQNFVSMGVRLLQKYPSSEHENIALMLLGKGDWLVTPSAAITLGKIGTKKSVEPLRQYVDSKTQMIEPSLRAAALARGSKDPLLAAQLELLARVQADERKSARGNKSGSDRPRADKARSPEDTAQANSSDGHGWTAWVIAAIIACGVIVWILRSRGHIENQ